MAKAPKKDRDGGWGGTGEGKERSGVRDRASQFTIGIMSDPMNPSPGPVLDPAQGPAARVRIVLVGTPHPGNIGAAARAMKTMGLSRLVLVAPEKPLDDVAYRRSAGAEDVLGPAPVVATARSSSSSWSRTRPRRGRCSGRARGRWRWCSGASAPG